MDIKLDELRFGKKEEIVPIIDNTGNISSYKVAKYYLQSMNKEVVSKIYYYMERIDETHYIVGDIGVASYCGVNDGFLCDTIFDVLYGVIRVQTDDDKNVIPNNEILVVPNIYESISPNNLNTLTAEVGDGHFTYIDIDRSSKNYGKQLTPAVLDFAALFDGEFHGFAQCSVNGIVGYLPRNCIVKEKIEPSDLLSREQVKKISKYFEMYKEVESSLDKYNDLTGTKRPYQKIKSHKKRSI